MLNLSAVFPVLKRNPNVGEWIAVRPDLDPYRELNHDEEGCSEVIPMLFVADAERDGRVTAKGTGFEVVRDSRRGRTN